MIATPFRENNEAKLVDPIGLDKILKLREEKMEAFMADVDVALSVKNATTVITI